MSRNRERPPSALGKVQPLHFLHFSTHSSSVIHTCLLFTSLFVSSLLSDFPTLHSSTLLFSTFRLPYPSRLYHPDFSTFRRPCSSLSTLFTALVFRLPCSSLLYSTIQSSLLCCQASQFFASLLFSSLLFSSLLCFQTSPCFTSLLSSHPCFQTSLIVPFYLLRLSSLPDFPALHFLNLHSPLSHFPALPFSTSFLCCFVYISTAFCSTATTAS